jgi:ATP-binding cassette, subfamily B, bacterial
MIRWRRRVPLVQQMTATDCGAAALAMVLGYHGRLVALDEVRRVLKPGRSGSSAASLVTAGGFYGLRGRSVTLDVDQLGTLPTGAILHWEFRHFVVFQSLRRDAVEINDPAKGHRSLPFDVFRKSFTGVAIVFEPTETFDVGGQASPSKPRRLVALFGQVLEQRGALIHLISVSIVVQLLSAAMPLLTGLLIDRVVPRKDYSLLLLLAVGYSGLQVLNLLSRLVREYLSIYLRSQLEATFTLRFLDHLIRLPYSFFQQRTSGDLMMRLGSNTAVRDILTSTLFSTVLDGMMASVYLVLLVAFSPSLTLLVLLLGGMRLAVLAVMRWKQRHLLEQGLENQARSQTAQVELLGAMETLKTMGLEHRAAESWTNVFVDGLNLSIRRGRLDAHFNVILNILGTVSTLLLMFYGAYVVLLGSWTLGSMMAFNALATGFLGPLTSLVQAALRLQLLEVYLARLNDVWSTPREQDGTTVSTAERLTGEVRMEHVSFRYGPDEPCVLQDITLNCAAGGRIAIVGRTGSGKSSLARLIAGLYEPTSGRVLLDGVDFQSLDRQSVRRQLGIVTQDAQLFGGSIRRNIAFSDPEMSLDRVVAAAKSACIDDEIMAMAMKYETLLGDRGLSLSGGQRQRVAIARALAANPRVLILDEGTSHLDAITEERLNANLARLRCTRIVIAHRLSTIRDADLIVVLDGGRAVEVGRHDVLIANGRIYAQLVAAQRESSSKAARPHAMEAL